MVNGSTAACAGGRSVVEMGSNRVNSARTRQRVVPASFAAVLVASVLVSGCGGGDSGSPATTTDRVIPTVTPTSAALCKFGPTVLAKVIGAYRYGEVPSKIVELLGPLISEQCQATMDRFIGSPAQVVPLPVEVGNKVVQVSISLERAAATVEPPTTIVAGGSAGADSYSACVTTFGFSTELVNFCMEHRLVPVANAGPR